MEKKMKVVLKEVDKVMKNIKTVIPNDFKPQQVAAIFNLYMSLYEEDKD